MIAGAWCLLCSLLSTRVSRMVVAVGPAGQLLTGAANLTDGHA
jgi:hypothetical protein